MPCTASSHPRRYELGSEDDDLDAFRRSKNPSLKPRFHVMLVGGTSRCARCARRAVLPFVLPLSALQDGASVCH